MSQEVDDSNKHGRLVECTRIAPQAAKKSAHLISRNESPAKLTLRSLFSTYTKLYNADGEIRSKIQKNKLKIAQPGLETTRMILLFKRNRELYGEGPTRNRYFMRMRRISAKQEFLTLDLKEVAEKMVDAESRIVQYASVKAIGRPLPAEIEDMVREGLGPLDLPRPLYEWWPEGSRDETDTDEGEF